MCTRAFLWLSCATACAGLFICSAGVRADQPPPLPQGVEVLTRGPVHEAFAQVPDVNPVPTPVVPKQPPAPIDELPPDQKPEGENVQWIPGYWAWDSEQSDFVWVSGIWRVPPPGRQWVPGHWQQVQGGWQRVSGLWMDLGQTDLRILPPPPAPLEQAPAAPAPDATSTYVPGIWIYQQTGYVWRPGFWVANHPGWIWTPAHYVSVPSGCIFVDGFWDYPLENRGLLFAPVRITPQLLVQRNWHYWPSYVVRTETLLDALFVGPRERHYYFGDYFGPRYQKLGFVSWADYHVNRHTPDVLFSYYRHRPDGQRWEHELRELHAARHRGQGPLLPRTFVQQNEVIQNFHRERNVNQAAVNHVTVVHPLGRAEAGAPKLGPVPNDQHEQVRRALEWHRQVQQQRQAHEAQFVTKGGVPVTHADAARTLRLAPAPHPPGTPVKTPPHPVMPAHTDKPHK